MVPFRILALGGGGTKGFLHIGALQELEARLGNLTVHFKKGIYGCSIGSVIATGIGFGLNVTQMERISKRCMNLMFIFDGINVASLSMASVKKGVVGMDSFEKRILSAFDSEGVDLRNKKLSDSKIPLYVFASNMTRGIPTIFKDNVPIMSALKASCCIPFLFQPQVIGNCVYLDGGLITNDIHRLIPKEQQEETLSIYLIHSNPHITPANLEKLSSTEYAYKLYKTVCLYDHAQHFDDNILNLYYAGSGFTDKSDEEKDEMITAGKCLTRIFLSKRTG
jgi:hypothetical protein